MILPKQEYIGYFEIDDNIKLNIINLYVGLIILEIIT